MMKRTLGMCLTLVVAAGAWAQTAATGAKATTKKKSATAATAKATAKKDSTAEELAQIKDLLNRQQQEIESLKSQLAARDQATETARRQAADAQAAASQASTKADDAASQVAATRQTVSTMQSDLTDVKANATTAAVNMQEQQKRVNELVESPLALHYKGVTITPGGFFAMETVWRQHGMTSDVNTPFNSVPYPGFGGYHLSEFFGSGRPSRPMLLIEANLPRAKFTAYGELDWLSAGVTSNNNQSNSYTNRFRQLWSQVALTNGWTFTAGQMWSLVTERKSGVDNRTEAVPSVIDHQYNVGFSWARQFGFRVTKKIGNRTWLAFSVENAQTLMTAHGNVNNFVFGNAGTGGGLYNPTANYSYNVSPDYITKAAFEPTKNSHYEIFGVFSPMRDRVYPGTIVANAPATGSFNDTKIGFGGGANARWYVANRKVEFALHYLGGNGIGRYGTSTLPDATINPDGTLSLLTSHQGLAYLEFHQPKFDVYFNGGTEHISRDYKMRNGNVAVGYGAPQFNNSGCSIEIVPAGGNGFTPGGPANCNGDTRNLIEYSAGFYFKFYNGPKGKVQWGPQYSYIIRNTWSGVGGGPQTTENMLITSFRYYLP